MTWGVPLSVSYHFAFSYCSWGSQGKNTEVVCHSLPQWTTFCQTSPPWPKCLGWPHTAWLSFTELDKAVVCVIRLASCLWLWFQSVCPLMPSLSAYHLSWLSLTLDELTDHTCIMPISSCLSRYLPVLAYIERKGTYPLLCLTTFLFWSVTYLGVKEQQLMSHTPHFICHGFFILVFIRTLLLFSLFCQSSI